MAGKSGVELAVHFRKKVASGLFGGEGLFNTVVTGPGHIWLQIMPISSVANTLIPYMPIANA